MSKLSLRRSKIYITSKIAKFILHSILGVSSKKDLLGLGGGGTYFKTNISNGSHFLCSSQKQTYLRGGSNDAHAQ